MKPLVQKLPLHQNSSFVAQTFRTPNFEVGWHQHTEHELILFTEGSGLSFVGNSVGEFETGDIYLLGSNLPHTFQKQTPDLITSAVVVQFSQFFWGNDFLDLPESKRIKQLLETSLFGLKIGDETKKKLFPLIVGLETDLGFNRILNLGHCLELIADHKDYTAVSTQEVKPSKSKEKEYIDSIIQFTIDHFKEPITLTRVADRACMSVPAFCSSFKKTTKKTYIDFLNEVRIGYACTLLSESKKQILDICYESGYNTKANFHNQFLKIKKVTPLQYRKYFTTQIGLPQRNIHIVQDH